MGNCGARDFLRSAAFSCPLHFFGHCVLSRRSEALYNALYRTVPTLHKIARYVLISPGRIFYFLKREKLYIFLLIFVILIHASFSFLNQFFEDSGMTKLFEEKKFEKSEPLSSEKIEEILDSHPVLYLVLTLLVLVFILFVIVGLAIDIVFLYLNRKNKIIIGRTQLIESARWDFWDICKVAIIFLFAQSALWLMDIFFFSTIPYFQSNHSFKLMFLATTLDITAIVAVFYFVLSEKCQSANSLGLTTKKFLSNVKYGIVSYVGLIPSLALVMFLTMIALKMFNIPIEPQPVVVILEEEKHIPSLIYLCLFAGLFGPFMEEIFFRGFVYGVLKKKLGIFRGIIISALFFACIHANLASFFPIMCLGILLAYLYEKTGSLIPSITVHVIHNSIMLTFALFLKTFVG